MRTRRLSLVLVVVSVAALVAQAAADDVVPRVETTSDSVAVVCADQRLTLNLANAVLDLTTPFRAYSFSLQILHGAGWTSPLRAERPPEVGTESGRTHVRAVFPVADRREVEMEIDARRGVPAVFVTSRLRTLGDTRSEYCFWSWQGTFDHYFVPGKGGPERRAVEGKAWTRFGHHDWVFLPAQSGGLAVMSNGTVGRAPGDGGEPYLNALPRSKHVGLGDSLDVSFGIAGVQDASQAAAVFSAARKHRIPLLQSSAVRVPPPDVDYGQPAPEWLRNADLYNGFYKPKPDWSRANIRDWLSDIPLVVGVPHDRAVIDRCHRAGIRVIPYVNYMELLDTKVELEARDKLYYEWLQAVDHEALDLSKHPDWICIDSEGKQVHSTWGSQNGHPGLFYTCFHQNGLRDAALAQVRKLMEMGADGVFIDNAGPVTDCRGEGPGHKHTDDSVSNTALYECLQRDIHSLVKSYGSDRVVMQNSGIIPSHWAYCDAQMWESCYAGAGTAERMHDWPELRYAGELHAEAVRQGKVPVILSYLDSQPASRRHETALFTYAYARLYGFLWADWFALSRTDDDCGLAHALYRTRLGKPLGQVRPIGEALYREFEQGLVVVNPASSPLTVSVPARRASYTDVDSGDPVIPSNGSLRLDLAPESGRVMVTR